MIGGFLELLAGIPSVVIGLWGVLTFGPFIAKYIAPVAQRRSRFPFFQGDVGHGQGLLDVRPGTRRHGDPDHRLNLP